MKRSDLQARIATVSFIVAVAFSVAGFIVEPMGDLTEANLYLIAQFLLVTTSIFGVSSIVNNKSNHANNRPYHNPLLSGEAPPDEHGEAD